MTAPLFTPRQRIFLWLACSAIFFEAFDVSIVNLALPVMATDLHIPLPSTQWIQTLYLLSFGSFLLLGGRLCDHYGSRTIFIAGMLLFGLTSLAAALSHHLVILLLARSGQGIGAALSMPGGISLLSRHFKEGEQRQHAFGIFGAFAAIGFAGGLALGGLITVWLNWHWIFGINVPVIGGVLVAAAFYIPEEQNHQPSSINVLTAIWLTLTLLVFCYGVHEASSLGWWLFPFLIIASISGILLLRYDLRRSAPFFQPGIYSSSMAYRGMAVSSLLGASFLSFVFICTLILEEVFHWDTRSTGLLLFPYSIGSALVSSYLLPQLFRKMKVIRVGQLAMACLLAGALLLAAALYTHQLIFLLLALFLVNSVCIAMAYPAFTILSLTGVATRNLGMASGLQSAIYSIGSGIGLSILGLCLQSFSRYSMDIRLLSTCGIIAGLCATALLILRKAV